MADLYAQIFEIYDYGAQIASRSQRITACDFLDKVIFAQQSEKLLYWNGSGNASDVPGLPPNERYKGVNTFQGFLIVWQGDRLKWSDQNDFTAWIPVGTTTSSFVFNTTTSLTLAAAGLTMPYVYVDQDPKGLIAGQFIRIDSFPYYTFFEVVAVTPTTGQTASVCGFVQSVPAGATKDLFITDFIPYLTGGQLHFGSSSPVLQVTQDAVDAGSGSFTVAEDFDVPPVDSTADVVVSTLPNIPAGSYVSVGSALYPGQDIYFIEAINLSANTLTLRRTGVGLSSPGFHPAGSYIVAQNFVRVTNVSNITATGGFTTPLKELYGISLKKLDLTGSAPTSFVYGVGTQVETIDANGAGELVNAGGSINGPICSFITLADYGYILKRRSIQSVQFTGIDQGTFDIRPEITTEGLLGDYSFVKVANDTLYFWGNREIYSYSGGSTLTPIAQSHTRQVFAEVDVTKANQIFGFHNELDSEIWFVYPRKDANVGAPLRVFIYNYLEQSATIDDYPTSIGALTAAQRLDWSNDVIWSQSIGTWIAPGSWASDAQWADLGADTFESFNILGAEPDTGGTLVHGSGNGTFTRLGEAYDSVWESIDFDAGDPEAFKYADTVILETETTQEVPSIPSDAVVSISLGSRDSLGAGITWTGPVTFPIGAFDPLRPMKLNLLRSGRYLRIRIACSVSGFKCPISQIRIQGRLGNTF